MIKEENKQGQKAKVLVHISENVSPFKRKY